MPAGICTGCGEERDRLVRVCGACHVMNLPCADCAGSCAHCQAQDFRLISECDFQPIPWAERGGQQQDPMEVVATPIVLPGARAKVCKVFDYPKSKIDPFRKRYGLREGREGGYSVNHIVRRALYRVNEVVVLRRPDSAIRPQVVRAQRGLHASTLQPAPGIGFLATVPCPVVLNDVAGRDRHPVTLAQMYCEQYRHEIILWERLRVLIAVNLRDDWRHVADTTADAAKFLSDYVAEINGRFAELGLPAAAIGVLWGPVVVKPQQHIPYAAVDAFEPLHVDAVKQIALSTDALREKLKSVALAKNFSNKPAGLEFPFASFRAALVASPEAETMIEELKRTNTEVFIHTGDADLLDLCLARGKPLHDRFKPGYLFPLVEQRLKDLRLANKPPSRIGRAGGAFAFTSEDILAQLEEIGGQAAAIDMVRSELLTHLAKSLDTIVRGILGSGASGAAYFAEPNSFLNARLRKNNVKLGEITNEAVGSMPDWSSEVNRRIKTEGMEQILIAHPYYCLGTSSRHALVVRTDNSQVIDTRSHTRVGLADTPFEILLALKNEHNTQISESQLNERFKERGGTTPRGALKNWLPGNDDLRCHANHLCPGWVARSLWGVGRDGAAINECFAVRDSTPIEKYAALPDVVSVGNLRAHILAMPEHAERWRQRFPHHADMVTTFRDYWFSDEELARQVIGLHLGQQEAFDQQDLLELFATLFEIDIAYQWGLVVIREILLLK